MNPINPLSPIFYAPPTLAPNNSGVTAGYTPPPTPLLPTPVTSNPTYQAGYSAGIANITQNHTYQALAALNPSQLNGTNFQQSVQQAAQNSQTQGAGGLWGGLGGALTGAIIGGSAGSVIPIIGTGIGALAGGLLGAGLGAFTPFMQTPQNAIVKGIQDIENGQGGNILPDIGKQLIAQQAVPNFHDVFEKSFLGALPNHSLLGNDNIPILSGLTNPNAIGEFAFNVGTNPFSYAASPEAGLGKLGAEDIANMGIENEVKGITGSLENNALTTAGTVARNPIAQSLGYDSYASLVNASKDNPELLTPFNEQFGSLIKSNPEAYINNVALKSPLIPFTNIGVPVLSVSQANALSQNPLLQGIHDFTSPFTSSIGQLFGQNLGVQQLERQYGPSIAQSVANAATEAKGAALEDKTGFYNDLNNLVNKYSAGDLQNAADMVEANTPELAKNQQALQDFLALRNNFSNYVQANNPEELPFLTPQYVPKVGVDMQSPLNNGAENFLQKNFGFTPLMEKNIPSFQTTPGQVAKAAKAIQIGKFVDGEGSAIIGDPSELDITRLDTFKEPQYYKGVMEGTPVIGTAMNSAGEPLFETYLPTAEANAAYMKQFGRNLYEPNAILAMAKSFENANRSAEYNDFINRVGNIKSYDENGNLTPLVENAQLSKSTGKALKSQVEPSIEQLGKGQLKGKIVPNGLQNYIKENFVKERKLSNDFLSGLNTIGNFSRRLELLNPLYHPLHNITTNSLLGGISPTTSLLNTAKGYAPDALKVLNEDPLVQRMGDAGIELNGLNNALKAGKTPIDSLAQQFEPSGNRVVASAKNLLSKFNSYMANTNQAMELANKRVMFEKLIGKGLSDVEAANEINKVLPTYSMLSDFEKNYLNNLFPFYQWMKNNVGLWARHPSQEAVMTGLLNTINERTAGHQMALNPLYKQGDVYLGNFGGQDQYLNTRLPFMDVANFATNPLSFLESRVNPAISTAVHLANNTDYQGNPIYNQNLPAQMQQKSLLGINMDPRLAYAIQNTIIPLQNANKPMSAPTPLSIAQNTFGENPTSIKPTTQAVQEYMAQKNMVDAIAKQELKAGNITYQQANPYNASPSTVKHESALQQSVYNLQDQLYGYHYVNGNKVTDNSSYTTKHYTTLSRRHGSSMLRSARREASYVRKKTAKEFKVPHIKL